MDMFSLKGKNAWVTGGAYGIGFAIARASITISADNKSGIYGEGLQALTYTVGGAYVAGDELGVSVASGVKKDSDAGT